jgi:acyl-CoA thioesterase
MTIARTKALIDAPMMALLNQKVVNIGDGTSTVECVPEAKFENSMGRMHGGFIASLIDTAMGCAVSSKVPKDVSFGTIDMNVKFVRRVGLETGLLVATANVVHAGRSMLTVEAKVADKTGKLYAHGSGSFLVYPKQ